MSQANQSYFGPFVLGVLALLVLVSTTEAARVSAPVWTHSVPPSDKQFFYAVGIGEASSAAQAKKDAERQANSDLVQMIFGVATVSSSRTKSSLSKVEMNKTSQEITDIIFLKSAETIELYSEETQEKKIRMYALKRYPRKEAAAMEKKVKNEGSLAASQLLNRVRIDSHPGGAEFFINDAYQGVTPVTVLLPPGNYAFSLKKSGYSMAHRKLILETAIDQNVTVDLEPARGGIKIYTEPPLGLVSVDGARLGKSPLHASNLSSGEHIVSISKEGYESASQKVSIEGSRTLELHLTLTPAHSNEVTLASLQQHHPEIAAAKMAQSGDWPNLFLFSQSWFNRSRNNPLASYYAGMASLRLAQNDLAIKHLSRSLSLKSDPATAALLCSAYYQSQYYAGAETFCRKAVEMNPHLASNYGLLAFTYEALSNSFESYKYPSSLSRALANMRIAAQFDPYWKPQVERLCSQYFSGNC